MCSNTRLLTRTEYDAVSTLLSVLCGYHMTYDEVKESELLSLHFKYAYVLTHWSGDVIDAYIDKLDREQHYALILLNKLFIKLSD